MLGFKKKKKKSFHPTPHMKRFHLKEVNDLHARAVFEKVSAVTLDTQTFGTFPATPEPETAQRATAEQQTTDESSHKTSR